MGACHFSIIADVRVANRGARSAALIPKIAVTAQCPCSHSTHRQRQCDLNGGARKMAHCAMVQGQCQPPRFGPGAKIWKRAWVTQDLVQWVKRKTLGWRLGCRDRVAANQRRLVVVVRHRAGTLSCKQCSRPMGLCAACRWVAKCLRNGGPDTREHPASPPHLPPKVVQIEDGAECTVCCTR